MDEFKPVGAALGDIVPVVSVDPETRFAQIKENCGLVKERVSPAPPHKGTAIIVCYGPSLKQTWPGIRWERNHYPNAKVVTVSGAHDFLVDHGIRPNFHVECDPREHKARMLNKPQNKTEYLLATAVHPSYVKKLKGKRLTLWHSYEPNIADRVERELERNVTFVNGGGSVGDRAVCLMWFLGYRNFIIHGMDASYDDEGTHAGEHTGKVQAPQRIRCGERWYLSSKIQVVYARGFIDRMDVMVREGGRFQVHGPGLLGAMIREVNTLRTIPDGHEVSYDLNASPASWDFLTWLYAAKMDAGDKPLKVRFLQGAVDGYRDGLRSKETSDAILNNVMRPALSLIGAEQGGGGQIEGPVPYTAKAVVDRWRKGLPLPELKPSAEALKWAEQYHGYYTITLREAEHWPRRNSAVHAWEDFAHRLDRPVVFIRDTERAGENLREFATAPEASRSLDFRLALYSVARQNFMVANGPVTLVMFNRTIPYMVVNKSPDDYPLHQPDKIPKVWGINHGEQWPWAGPHQRMVWSEDSFEELMAAWSAMQMEKAA